MKANKTIIYILTSAVAGALLLAVAGATALGLPATVNAAAIPVAAVDSPAVSVDDGVPQLGHQSAGLLWILVGTGVMTCLSGLILWRSLRQIPILAQSPRDIALERLDEARAAMNPDHAREYCLAVSQIIRGYVEGQLFLNASRQTAEEFLHELAEGKEKLTAAQRALLGDFLGHCDLAKFAGWRYSREALSNMHKTAVKFVQQTSGTVLTTQVVTNPATPATDTALLRKYNSTESQDEK